MNQETQQMIAWYRAEIERLQTRSNELAFANTMQRTAIMEEIARYVNSNERDGLIQTYPLLRHLREVSSGLALTGGPTMGTARSVGTPLRLKRERESYASEGQGGPQPPHTPQQRVATASQQPTQVARAKRCRDSVVEMDNAENEYSHESEHFHMPQPTPSCFAQSN